MTVKIIWLTGNSGSGKTTLANALQQKLFNWVVLDGNVMRNSISLNSGFSKEDREEHNLRVARLAKVLYEQNKNVLVSVIAPFTSTRKKISKMIDCDWVYITRRKEKKGKEYPYEVPLSPSVILDNLSLEEEIEKVIKDLRLFHVFVLGVPRSGTSMMTRILELLGVNMVYTTEEAEKKEKRDERFKKALGEYHPNKLGFFEIADNIFDNWNKVIGSNYSGCKTIIPLFGMRLDAITSMPSKVIMMLREPEEIRQSQEAFYSCRTDVAQIRTSLAEEKLKLKKLKSSGKIDFICVDYRKVLENPQTEILKVAEFINSPNDIGEAVKSVNSGVNRFRLEELEDGI